MKFKSLVNRLEKNGFKVESREHGKDCRFYWAKGKKYEIEFYDDWCTDSARCVYLKRIDAKDDLMSDYFCGWFPSTIKSIIEKLKEGE